jgi:hypothetical protein
MSLKFSKKHKNFLLEDIDETGKTKIVSAFVNLAFVFDSSCGVIHKFGEESAMQKYITESKDSFLRMGFRNEANNLTLISSEIWPLDIINKFISKPGFLDSWYKEQMANIGKPEIPKS